MRPAHGPTPAAADPEHLGKGDGAMSGTHRRPGSEALPLLVELRVDAVCRRFEAAWRAGRRPRIEDHLGEAPEPESAALLYELLALELIYRRRIGERPAPGEYRQRFPKHCRLVDAV